MSLTIPSSTVKSKFLKSLPIGTIFKDPRNEYSYQVIEKKVNSTLSKSAIPYIGQDEPISIDVPEKYLKLKNPNRANIMDCMKQRLKELEEINSKWMNSNAKSTFHQIKDILNGKNYYETDDYIYCLAKECTIYPLRKSNYKSNQEALDAFDTYSKEVWKDHKVLQKVMSKQPKIQSKLLSILLSMKQVPEEGTRIIQFN